MRILALFLLLLLLYAFWQNWRVLATQGSRPGLRWYVEAFFALCSLFFCCFAIPAEEVAPSRKIAFLVDTSRSMTVRDALHEQSRLARSKELLRELIPALRPKQVALYTFTEDPALVVPYTSDLFFVDRAIDQLRVNDRGEVGSDLGEALQRVMRELPEGATAIVLGDGGDRRFAEDPLSRKQELVEAVGSREPLFIGIGQGDHTLFAALPGRYLPDAEELLLPGERPNRGEPSLWLTAALLSLIFGKVLPPLFYAFIRRRCSPFRPALGSK